ncbi:MAG: penicillin-binding protein activator [Methyloligellaceae bacterium]
MGQNNAWKSLAPLTRRTVLGVAAAGFLTACAGGSGKQALISGAVNDPNYQPAASRPLQKRTNVKVALLLPVSAKGNTAKAAKALKQAGELALFEFDNPNILLITKDTKGTPEGARAAAQSAIKNGAELIIGPLFAKSVSSVAPIARQANVPVIGFSSDQSVAGNGVYLLSFLAGRDVPRIVSYAVGQGKKNFAALVPDTAYGRVVRAAFQKAVSANGGQVLAVEAYPLDANGMLEPARKISEAAKNGDTPIDALLIPGGPDTLPTLSPLIPYFEIDTKAVQLMGTGRWDFANIGRQKTLLGGWFPAPDPRGWREFTQRYVKTYGVVPPRIASLAYDAVSLAVSLSGNQPGQRYGAAQITRASGFAGVDGLFRLLPNGTSERGLAILEVQKFGSRVVDAAPNVFGQAQF